MVDRFLVALRYGLGLVETRGGGQVARRVPCPPEPFRILRFYSKNE